MKKAPPACVRACHAAAAHHVGLACGVDLAGDLGRVVKAQNHDPVGAGAAAAAHAGKEHVCCAREMEDVISTITSQQPMRLLLMKHKFEAVCHSYAKATAEKASKERGCCTASARAVHVTRTHQAGLTAGSLSSHDDQTSGWTYSSCPERCGRAARRPRRTCRSRWGSTAYVRARVRTAGTQAGQHLLSQQQLRYRAKRLASLL